MCIHKKRQRKTEKQKLRETDFKKTAHAIDLIDPKSAG